jgi:hypothetical protein
VKPLRSNRFEMRHTRWTLYPIIADREVNHLAVAAVHEWLERISRSLKRASGGLAQAARALDSWQAIGYTFAFEEHRPVRLSLSQNQLNDAGWSSPVAREAHNLEVAGSNPVPAT